MSTVEKAGAADLVAGFLAAVAIAFSALSLVERPARVAPVAMLVALVAVGLAGPLSRRLAAFSLAATGLAWLLGMTIAIAFDRAIF